MTSPRTGTPDSVKIVQPIDHIDIGNAFELKAGLQSLLRSGQKRVVIDLAGVQYIDSAGLSALMAIVHAFEGAGGAVRLCCPQPTVLKILQLTKLDEYLPLAADLEEATDQLADAPVI